MKLLAPWKYATRLLTSGNTQVTVGIGVDGWPYSEPFISMSFQWDEGYETDNGRDDYLHNRWYTDVYLQYGGFGPEVGTQAKLWLGLEYRSERVRVESAELFYVSKLMGNPRMPLDDIFPHVVFDLIKPRFADELFPLNLLLERKVFG